MAIATRYKIKFTCGHTEIKDLGTTPPGKRVSKARWMGDTYTCTTCFKAADRKDLDKLNADTLADAEVFGQHHDLPDLEGSDKQLPWATRVRYQLLTDGLDDIGHDSPEAQELITAARTITRCGWWIDYKDADPDEVFEVVTTGAIKAKEQAQNHVASENPF
ncbi:hypothetical protein [Glutamicibacter uratoxydans]|uniref:hypothetical protein n=1 Tax=Glutamicibacter uratoxydans TaxID=43667 RepID=UPI003D6ED825